MEYRIKHRGCGVRFKFEQIAICMEKKCNINIFL